MSTDNFEDDDFKDGGALIGVVNLLIVYASLAAIAASIYALTRLVS